MLRQPIKRVGIGSESTKRNDAFTPNSFHAAACAISRRIRVIGLIRTISDSGHQRTKRTDMHRGASSQTKRMSIPEPRIGDRHG